MVLLYYELKKNLYIFFLFLELINFELNFLLSFLLNYYYLDI